LGVEQAPVAKITRPVLPGNYPRKRLYRMLDQARKLPITWVSGPPGSGKTMSVSGYMEARRLRGIWYEVDDGDGDPATFFYYLGMAGTRAAPRDTSPFPLLTPEFLRGLKAFTQRFFENLFGRLGVGAVLVFDNCQNAPSRSPFFGLLREGLARLPQGITAILISRNNLPVEFARNKVHRQIRMLGWQELRLTVEETRGIARLQGRRRITGEEIREAHRRADGWAAGVTLLLDAEGAAGKEKRTLARRPPGEIFDYFAGEIYSRLGKGMKSFLLRSAFLPRMTVGMAERLTGNPRAGEILSDLSRNNYFTETHSAPEPIYRYHDLFREFLLLRAQNAFPGEEGQMIRREAASILLEGGQAEDAVEYLRMAEDWSGLTRVILREAPALIGQGRNQVLSDWIRYLPEEHYRATPWLTYWLGAAILPFDPVNARRLFEESLARFRQGGDGAGAFLSLSGIVPAVWFGRSGFETLDSIPPLLDELHREFGGFPSPEIEARVLCSMIQVIAWRLPKTVDFDAWIDRARAVADGIQDIALKSVLVNAVLNCWVNRGIHIDETASLYASIDPLLGAEGTPPIVRIETLVHATINSIHRGEYDRALEIAAEGLKHAEASDLHFADMFLLGHATIAAMNKGDAHAARNSFRRMGSLLPKEPPHGAAFYYHIATCEALGRGDVALAERHWKTAMDFVMKAGFAVIIHGTMIMGALVMHVLGKADEARRLVREARGIESGHRIGVFSFFATLLESTFLAEDGNVAGEAAKLREAMGQGRELGVLGTQYSAPKFMAHIMGRALREGIEVPYVQEMIRKNRLFPSPGDLDLEEWPWPVRIYTLGRFSLAVDGAPPPSGRKSPQKPLQLLKALIAMGGREVPEEKLCEALWPDADGDLANQSLSSNLKRLRRQLGEERSVLLREGCITLNNRYCWVDAWAFERILGQAGADRKPGSPVPDGREISRIAMKASALYRGAFLPDETVCPEVVSYRDRLRSKFLRTVMQAGRHWEQVGELEAAVACYQKGLEVDPLSEALCLSLILCHLQIGRSADAHAVYQRFRKRISDMLGVSPSPTLGEVLKSVSVFPGQRQM
jgi:LuxR family transcriptional regulator, maltose regulon positive regulatory protein